MLGENGAGSLVNFFLRDLREMGTVDNIRLKNVIFHPIYMYIVHCTLYVLKN